MSKQVEKTAIPAIVSPAPAAVDAATPQQTLFTKVMTFDTEGHTIGERIVDMYHFGTRKWLQTHLWWAMHNTAQVEITVATQKEVDLYLLEAKKKLATKFNGTAPQLAVVA